MRQRIARHQFADTRVRAGAVRGDEKLAVPARAIGRQEEFYGMAPRRDLGRILGRRVAPDTVDGRLLVTRLREDDARAIGEIVGAAALFGDGPAVHGAAEPNLEIAEWAARDVENGGALSQDLAALDPNPRRADRAGRRSLRHAGGAFDAGRRALL